MPRKPMDYSKTIIYKLVCNDLNITDIYIGHTTEFRRRKNEHKSRCCNPTSLAYNFYKYQFIREHGGWDNWSMILIENYPCINKLEAEKRERYWIEELNATLNASIPCRSKHEWHKLNYETTRKVN